MNQISDLCGVWACRQQEVRLLTGGTLALQQASSPVGGGSDVRQGVAIIYITGPLSKFPSWWSNGTGTVQLRNQIRAAAAAPDVRGIALFLDSPGGTAAGTLELANDILAARAQKPVVSYINDLGCSAAYWLAASASRVYANPAAIVGAIGTYTVVYDTSGLAAKAGVVAHVVRAGELKGAFAPGTPVSAEQLAEAQKVVNALNDHFLAGVATGRRMSRKAVQQLADGRVHVGQAAVTAGLVDEIKSFDAVLSSLVTGTIAATLSQQKGPPMDAIEQWDEAVREKIEATPKMSKADAVRAVIREQPELHQAYLAEYNQRHGETVRRGRR